MSIITQELYNGTITLDFHINPYHKYVIRETDERVPSVTKITGIINKPALIYWAVNLTKTYLIEKLENGEPVTTEDVIEASKQHQQKKQEAADKGTLVHEWAESYINYKLGNNKKPAIPKDEQVANGAMAFMQWIAGNKIEFHESEILLYSKKNGYAGMADCIATINGKKALIDFKTSKGIYNEMRYQVAGYRLAYEEQTGEKLDTAYIIKFDKETADVTTMELDNYNKDKKAFLGCLAITKRQEELK